MSCKSQLRYNRLKQRLTNEHVEKDDGCEEEVQHHHYMKVETVSFEFIADGIPDATLW